MNDRNYRSYVGESNRTITSADWQNPPAKGAGFDDVFKASHCENFGARNIVIEAEAAKEDAVDCVRGTNYLFEGCDIQGSITAKGSIDGFAVRRCLVWRVMEFGQFDDYWQPGQLPTRNIVIEDVQKPDEFDRIRVVLWDATDPTVINTRVQIWRVPKLIWYPYFRFRRWQQRLTVPAGHGDFQVQDHAHDVSR